MIWSEPLPGGSTQDRVLVRRFHAGLEPLTVTVSRGGVITRTAHDIGVDQDGRFVAVWTETTGFAGSRLHAQRFLADGTRLGKEITLAGAGIQSEARVAMNPATGDFVLFWIARGASQPNRILAQRFSFEGGQQGGVFQVNTTGIDNNPMSPEVGRAEDGSFVVAWNRVRVPSQKREILLQRFDAQGRRQGGEVLVARTSAVGSPVSVAVAPEGHYLLAWTEGLGSPVVLKLYREDGTAVGAGLRFEPTETPISPRVAFGWDGTFVLGWTDFGGSGTREVNYQRFEVPSDL